MPDSIQDGTTGAWRAKVDSNNRLHVKSKSVSQQHMISEQEQDAYQVMAVTTLSSGTVTALHVKNVDTSKSMVITYIRHQVVGASGGTAFPNTSNYFSARTGRTYASGGSTVTPVNVFAGSLNAAQLTVYSDPTLAGTASEFDRWYTKSDGDMNSWNKEGALIIPPQQTLELSYVGDHSSGSIFTRISFIMETEEE